MFYFVDEEVPDEPNDDDPGEGAEGPEGPERIPLHVQNGSNLVYESKH